LTEVCAELGTVLIAEVGLGPQDKVERENQRREGLKLLQQACDEDSPRGCWALAQSTATEAGPALNASISACSLGVAHACEELADSKRGGQLPVSFFQQGCQLGSIRSCREAAQVLTQSDTPSSFRAGLEIAAKFCSTGDAELCFTLSDALSFPSNPTGAMRAGVAVDSRDLYKQAEQSLESFCGVGYQLECRAGVKRKKLRELRARMNSQEMIRTARACESVDTDLRPESCNEYQAFLNEMCSLGVGQACNDLGLLLLRTKEKGGLHYLVSGCDRGYGRACYNLSRLPGGRKAADKTTYELRRLACDGGYSLAC
jgi:TPR repeat protein